MDTPNRWNSVPRTSIAVFLLAVFFVFASFGFVYDVMQMGRQSTGRFVMSVIISGVFAACYAATGMSMGGNRWKAFIPIFVAQFVCMGLLGHFFPNLPSHIVSPALELSRLQSRLTFDSEWILVGICLGYTGFVYVSISEGRRYVRAEGEKALLQNEMAAAREVQRVMVPEGLPRIEGYNIESIYRPAAEVGGDFFQVIPLRSGSALVVIGDVSGKGLRAAMIVSMIVGTLRTVSEYTEEPAEILSVLNSRLAGRVQDGFATCLVVRLDEQGKLSMANSGHLPPYRNGVELTLEGSLPLGVAEGVKYDQTSLQLNLGDAIVLLTDGVAEAQNEDHQLLGFSEVERLLRGGATAKKIAEHAQQFGQSDDITVIQVARTA